MPACHSHFSKALDSMDFRPVSYLKKLASGARGGPVWRGGAGDIVLKLASNGVILEISASAEKIIGAAGNLVGRSLFDFVRREDRAIIRETLIRAATGDVLNRCDERAEFRLLRLRRAPALAEISFLPIGGGQTKALIRDRAGELAKLRQSRAAAEEPSQTFESQANSSGVDMMADLSHELKTPLNAIMGFAETMQAETFGPLGNDKYKEYAGHIHSSGAHLLDLIGSILDSAKVDVGRYELTPSLTAPGPIARDCAEMVRGQAEAAGIKLTINIAPNLPEAMLDTRAVKQILINLLSNAVKFTADGSIDFSVSENCGALDFVVRDTGIGMNQIALAKLGGRFTEVHQNGVRGSTGSGLGLSLAFSLAKLHGGALRLDSATGEGTTARLTLPLRKSPGDFNKSQHEFSRAGDIQSQLDRVARYRRERETKASAA